jgi:antirestriction protein
MSVTLTSSYKTLKPEVVEKIEELLEDNYCLEDMLKFIDEYDAEDEFVEFYEEYVRCGEEIGYNVVDAYIAETDVASITDCDERYVGEFRNTEEFAEYYVTDIMGESVPEYVYPDWALTWDRILYYDHTACEVDYCTTYIFRDH